MRRVQEHPQFGPWIGFKVADMTERCLGIPVSFEHAEVFMFNDPKKAALLLWRAKAGLPSNAKPRDEGAALREVVGYLTDHFAAQTAPPTHDRPVGLQEVETILCKWKSHTNGHYGPNNDTIEIRDGLAEWERHSVLAQMLLDAMPEVTAW
jgi:hypothetical protein